MSRMVISIVVSSVVSCGLTLAAVSSGLVPIAQAAAQVPPVIQARGFEVVDGAGNRLAYLGEAQFSPAILVLGEHSEVQISTRSRLETQPRIELRTADGALIWQAP